MVPGGPPGLGRRSRDGGRIAGSAGHSLRPRRRPDSMSC